MPGESIKHFETTLKSRFPDHTRFDGGSLNRRAEKQIRQYLEGKRHRFDLKYDITGTPFQKKALRKVAAIPYGRTRTYGEIAQKLGNPQAARAVGSANARNCLPLVIPCHRVVAVNGLGGFAGGLALKKRLLILEGAL